MRQLVKGFIFVAAMAPAFCWSTPTYHVLDLGVLPEGSTSQALSVNDLDQAVGTCGFVGYGHAILWDGSVLHDIHPASEGGSSVGSGINNAGTVCMTANFNGYRYFSGTWTKLSASSTKPLSYCAGIGESGLIVGGSLSMSSPSVATVWGPNLVVGNEISFINGAIGSNAYGINDSFDIVGDCLFGSTQVASYFVAGWFYAGGAPFNGSLNATASTRWAAGRADSPVQSAVLVDLNTNTRFDLPTMPSLATAQAFGINASSTVVGSGTVPTGQPRGWVWNQEEGMLDLNDHLDGNWWDTIIVDAHGINRRGVIAGSSLINGIQHAVLLVPNTQQVNVESVQVNLGRQNQGDATNLASIDGSALEICKSFVPNLNVAPIQVTVEGTSPYAAPTMIEFRTRTKMSAAGSFSQTLQLFDWNAGAFGESRSDSVNTSWKIVDLYATGTPLKPIKRYIEPSTRKLRAKFSVKSTGFVATTSWCSQFDLAAWFVNP